MERKSGLNHTKRQATFQRIERKSGLNLGKNRPADRRLTNISLHLTLRDRLMADHYRLEMANRKLITNNTRVRMTMRTSVPVSQHKRMMSGIQILDESSRRLIFRACQNYS